MTRRAGPEDFAPPILSEVGDDADLAAPTLSFWWSAAVLEAGSEEPFLSSRMVLGVGPEDLTKLETSLFRGYFFSLFRFNFAFVLISIREIV